MSDEIKEYCGVFGVFGLQDAATLVALGLHALQHRGQESAGIASFDKGTFYSERRMGLVGDHFTNPKIMKKLPGTVAMGHVRYSTTGETALRNVQPLFAELNTGGFAIAHNGNLTNAITLRKQLIQEGAIFQSTSDTEVILHLVSRSKKPKLVERFTEALNQIEGAYSLVAITKKKLIGARDPFGIRPLVLGKLNNKFIIASETCALDIIGAEYVRDIENGEMVIISDKGIESHRFNPVQHALRPCAFEYVYFARPDSVVNGRSIYEVRKNLGRNLALENTIDADVVVPVPDGGIPAALGFAEHSQIPFDLGIIRNHYVGRTFIQPTQSVREVGVRMKHNINRIAVKDKRIALIDDSIVRGTTSVKIVQMLRDAGATEVHMLISSPPILYPDYYGIDTPDREKLLAATHSIDEMRNYIGCDTLKFLSLDGLYKAVGFESRDPNCPQLTDHCFTGDYPTKLTDLNGK